MALPRMLLIMLSPCFTTTLQSMSLEKKAVFSCRYHNKNRSVVGYLAWRCMVGLHEEIQPSFMIAGHTHCLVDGCFGLIKQKYRRSDCDTLAQLQKVLEDSASVNVSQLFQEPTSSHPSFKWYDWVSFLDERIKPVIGIRPLQHF